MHKKDQIILRLCAPRGFCAGVERAIETVLLALKKYGPPIYVRHEIVHNQYVVKALEACGAHFVEDLAEIPECHRSKPVIFSAHGVAKKIYQQANDLKLFYLDATCPLVSRVHKQALKHVRLGRHVLLIGHQGHPEIIGTMGQLPSQSVTLIDTMEMAKHIQPPQSQSLGFVTQTTLSIFDTKQIIQILKDRFGEKLHSPATKSICYATTNRQQSVQQAAPQCDLFFIVGSPNSSNSKRLVEVSQKSGAKETVLIQKASEINWEKFKNLNIIGLSAGASAPEILVKEIIHEISQRYDVKIELAEVAIENEAFLVSKELRDLSLNQQDLAFINGN